MMAFRGIVIGCVLGLVLWVLIIFAATKALGSECRFQHLDRGTWTQREEDRTARCVLKRFGPVPGGFPELRAVGDCESGWYRLAYNPAGYVGLFQHDLSAWADRVARWSDPWTLRSRWQNSRSQIVVTVRMAHAYGWGGWSCW
jgi:hypothetical protein